MGNPPTTGGEEGLRDADVEAAVATLNSSRGSFAERLHWDLMGDLATI